MEVTFSGIVTVFRLRQDSKADIPMVVKLLGRVSSASFGQFEKASLPMDVTPSGMATEVRLSQPPKVACSIFVTLDGIVTEVNPVKANANIPTLVTLSGIAICVSASQLSNAYSRISVIPLGRIAEASLVQSSKAL